MTYYIKKGNRFTATDESNIDIRSVLPVGTYVVMLDEQLGSFYLETSPDVIVTQKIYGKVMNQVSRIMNTWKDRTRNTGVLLTGEKGSGKTMLAHLLSQEFRNTEDGITILVNQSFVGDLFTKFIDGISQKKIVFFDEFEKIYNDDRDQQKILTLLDGSNKSNTMFIFCCNLSQHISRYMKNRPGRFFYSFEYKGLSQDFISDYCKDVLLNKTHIDEVIRFTNMFDEFNFDMLKAVVEEMNRYGESVKEVSLYLNTKPESEASNYTVTEITLRTPQNITGYRKDIDNVIPFNNNHNIRIWYEIDNKNDDTYLDFTMSDLKLFDADGTLYYENDYGSARLQKKKKVEFSMVNLL